MNIEQYMCREFRGMLELANQSQQLPEIF